MNNDVKFLDCTGITAIDTKLDGVSPAVDWPPVIITASQINAEVERLASLPRPANGRRQTQFVHPSACGLGRGLNPGVQVTLDVLMPGEETAPIRHNSTQVNFCIRGSGSTVVGGKRIAFKQYDVWNHPSFVTYRHKNDGGDLQVRLTYSNAPLLRLMRVHLVDENPPTAPELTQVDEPAADPNRTSPYGSFQLTEDGAWLMPYEILINPPAAESKALHWAWTSVQANLDKLAALGKSYVGRRLYLLYNPMTGRFNGTTPSFFATMTIRPPKIIDRPHRHVSSAINYYFHGKGFSVVDGTRYHWQAGDLMVSAPGWAIHNHASLDEPVYELTVQDQPLNIAMESLLW
ncbi:MAG: gentisate 1,2-dioxygenase, partial [Gammaproteobacteria bacterium]|nr:gentisate 1,2-dioxygenase [Gammaproteobacteria bacterium]